MTSLLECSSSFILLWIVSLRKSHLQDLFAAEFNLSQVPQHLQDVPGGVVAPKIADFRLQVLQDDVAALEEVAQIYQPQLIQGPRDAEAQVYHYEARRGGESIGRPWNKGYCKPRIESHASLIKNILQQESAVANLFKMRQGAEDSGDVVDADFRRLVHHAGPELVNVLVTAFLVVRIEGRDDFNGVADLREKLKPFQAGISS